jgi:hypothetical protein
VRNSEGKRSSPSPKNPMLNHGSTSEPFIQSDHMEWRFAAQHAPAILDGAVQADIVRALCAELCGEAMTFGRLRNG